ncbi:MAG: NAD-dependent epimerase/dehydratase family protein [Candidatus Dadabacteria bacterium]|nr:MAG: NAD-dependent epimerase/dehydratase family protein [Candidatus Dadabacteria bacterium]
MPSKTVLITGANGEIGHGLINFFAQDGSHKIIALDIHDIDDTLTDKCSFIKGSVLDEALLEHIFEKYSFEYVFHLAGILSTGGEKNPLFAHQVNVTGSLNLLNFTRLAAKKREEKITFLFPSSIAAYGIPTLEQKKKAGKISEEQYLFPITMYGCNKLYIEHMGRYFEAFYGLLEPHRDTYPLIDFRSIRFPGIISAETIPTGGTSDYGPEMVHSAAQGKSYSCFVRQDTTLPFVVMPEAVDALIKLSEAKKSQLTRQVYNITSFSVSASQIAGEVKKYFPQASISYSIDPNRQKIVDSWPGDVDDTKARSDWGWKPRYSFESAFAEYLMPAVIERYRCSSLKKCQNSS